MMHSYRIRILGCLAATGMAVAGWGQVKPSPDASASYLIDSATNAVPGPGRVEVKLDGRFLQGDEKAAYGGLAAMIGLGSGWAIDFRGAFANRDTYAGDGATIRHGGTDLEGQVRYAVCCVDGLTVAAGVSDPSTPAEDSPYLTASAVYRLPVAGFGAYIGTAGAFRNDATLTAVTLAAEVPLARGLSAIGEGALMLSGENTLDAAGNSQRVSTYAVGLRYAPTPGRRNSLALTVAWTNALGDSTAFSMSPGLSNSAGLYVGVTVRG